MNKTLQRLTIDIPKEDHKKLKSLAALNGISIRSIIMEFINNELLKKDTKITNKD